jgi:iron(III) transport system substrate-binding protein
MSNVPERPDHRLTRRGFGKAALGVAGAAATGSLSTVLAGCGGGGETDTTGGDAPGLAAITDPARKQELTKLIEGAKKEGKLTVWDTIISPETWEKIDEDFKSYWGLGDNFETQYTTLTTSQFVTKVTEEMKADRLTMDVGGSPSIVWLNGLVDEGKVMKYASPEIANAYSTIYDKKLGRKGYYASNVYYFVPAWNPETVKKDFRSWNDVLDPAFGGGKIIMGDASLSESYTLVHIGLRKILGLDYFERLAALKPAFKIKSQDIAQDLATGEHPVAFSGMPTRIYQFVDKGVDLKFTFPEEGTVLIPQATFMLRQAPHPNAAKLYTEYFLSEKGQKVYVKGEAVSSGRNRFKSPVPKFAPPIEDVKAIDIDWTKVTPEEFDKGRQEWMSIFKNG